MTNRFTPIVAGLLLAGTYPISAEDISVEEAVKVDLRAIGQTQGAGTPNAIGAGAFVRFMRLPMPSLRLMSKPKPTWMIDLVTAVSSIPMWQGLRFRLPPV